MWTAVVRASVRAAVAGAILALMPPVIADEAARFQDTFKRIDAYPSAKDLYAACPADIFRTKAPFRLTFMDAPQIEHESCDAHPALCVSTCLDGQNPEACFKLALAMQFALDDTYARYSEILHAEACATGAPEGCTNRAAGIRNGGYAGDPFVSRPPEEAVACLLASFTLACDEGDPWGCAMTGQAHFNGEGTVADPDKAKTYFDKACAIAPDFDACDFGMAFGDEQDPKR